MVQYENPTCTEKKKIEPAAPPVAANETPVPPSLNTGGRIHQSPATTGCWSLDFYQSQLPLLQNRLSQLSSTVDTLRSALWPRGCLAVTGLPRPSWPSILLIAAVIDLPDPVPVRLGRSSAIPWLG